MKLGDKSIHVRNLQGLLNRAGAAPQLETDGWFGDKTEQAVIAFQKKNGIPGFGTAGPRTMAALGLNKNADLLTTADLKSVADYLGVEMAAIAAIAEVESAGSGRFSNGKTAILFERHIFYRHIAAEDKALADSLHAKHPNICHPRPGGYIGGIGEYQRFGSAKTFHSEAAYSACSYGMFQIMGFHAKSLGYESAQEFAEAMSVSQGNQLRAVAEFIKNNPQLQKALVEHDWAAFARGYNGPSYATHGYDTRIKTAYENFAVVYKTAKPKAEPKTKKTSAEK